MNRTANPSTPRHTTQYYRKKEAAVFSTIPGMDELIHADYQAIDALREKYPDAAFALMTANNLFAGDHEQNLIHQKAYFAILEGETIPNIRFRYDKDMDAYVQQHMWD